MKRLLLFIPMIFFGSQSIAQENDTLPVRDYKLSVYTSIGPAIFFSTSQLEDDMIKNHFNGDYSLISIGSINIEANYPKSHSNGTLMRGFGIMYNLTKKADVGVYVNSNFKYTLEGYRSADAVFIQFEYNEWTFGGFIQYKPGIFEVELGPTFQVYNFHFKDYSDETVSYNFLSSHRKQGFVGGFSAGFQLAIPKKISMFDYIFGLRLHGFFNRGETPYVRINSNGHDFNYPSFDFSFSYLQVYFAFRFNFLDKNKQLGK